MRDSIDFWLGILEESTTVPRLEEGCLAHLAARPVHSPLKTTHVASSPRNVPAARMANPSPRPHTRPMHIPMISCPTRGGKLTMTRKATGIIYGNSGQLMSEADFKRQRTQPAGQSFSFFAPGLIHSMISSCLTVTKTDKTMRIPRIAYHSARIAASQ
jgi:hypothetical protein